MRALWNRFAFAPVLVVLAACTAQPNSSSDTAAEEAAIRAVDQQLLAAARANDAMAFAALFAPDGQLLFPNRPRVTGQEAIRETVAADFAMPGFNVSWEQSDVMVAESGDLAITTGNYQLTISPPEGPVEDHGKYITVWRKIDGAWRIAADMINSDAPVQGM